MHENRLPGAFGFRTGQYRLKLYFQVFRVAELDRGIFAEKFVKCFITPGCHLKTAKGGCGCRDGTAAVYAGGGLIGDSLAAFRAFYQSHLLPSQRYRHFASEVKEAQISSVPG